MTPLRLSLPGLALGAVCFAATLTPSLIPRTGLLQGVLAGLSFSAGYGLGVMASGVWKLLGLPVPHAEAQRRLFSLITAAGLVLALWALLKTPGWQQALHEVMGLPPVEPTRALIIAPITVLTAVLLILTGRLFLFTVQFTAARLTPLWPPRVALLVGVLVALAVFNFIGNDLILERTLAGLDASYAVIDSTIPAAAEPPEDPLATGSPDSLIAWEGIGAEGRQRVLDPLDAAMIAQISGRPALEPLRIYVGLGSAATPEERAALALQEAIRVGVFERAALVIATPTGTGWIDPAGAVPLEALTGGDVATISVQYSYLPSWLALTTIPDYGVETARATFLAIYAYWRSLPRDSRPGLYLFGLSLGSLNSDLSADFYDLIGDPFQGAFWIGPPFASRSWTNVTAGREPGSPAWLPRFRDGSVVRFLNQFSMPDENRPWGPLRIVYLQHASDAITFFSPSILWRKPDWMAAPRAPDVIEEFRWLPVVTFLQVGLDLLTATAAPRGYGHVFSGDSYMRGWRAVLPPDKWDAAALDRLRAALAERGLMGNRGSMAARVARDM
jgi:uncharacterized membrane protein